MEVPTCKAAVLLVVVVVLVLPEITVVLGRNRHVAQSAAYSRSGDPKDRASTSDNFHHHHHQTKYLGRSKSTQFEAEKKRSWRRSNGRPETLHVAGSKLPDCSHACGSCSPCRLEMVSFICSSIQEAETCPMAYKCMCNSKSYPVP